MMARRARKTTRGWRTWLPSCTTLRGRPPVRDANHGDRRRRPGDSPNCVGVSSPSVRSRASLTPLGEHRGGWCNRPTGRTLGLAYQRTRSVLPAARTGGTRGGSVSLTHRPPEHVFTTAGPAGRVGIDGRIPQPCVRRPDCCSPPACWPQPSSARPAGRRRPRSPRRPRRPPGARPCRPPTAGPSTQNPIPSTWGVDGRALATAVIGNRVYVGGTFTDADVPDRHHSSPATKLAAFCLANGALDTSFVPNLGATTITSVNALATDGANLFVGGDFLAGGAPLHLVKVSADWRPHRAVRARRLRRARCWTCDFAGGVLYAAGDFGKIGAPPAGNQNYVGNAAGFNAHHGCLDHAGSPARAAKVESITVSPDGTAVFIGGNFPRSRSRPGDARRQLVTVWPGSPWPRRGDALDGGLRCRRSRCPGLRPGRLR